MTVLSVIADVCEVIGLDSPTQIFASMERAHGELAALANEIAERSAFAYEWQALKKVHAIVGDGVTTETPLPGDYARMLASSALHGNAMGAGFRRMADMDEWISNLDNPSGWIGTRWALFGDALHFAPVLSANQTVRFGYQSRNIVRAADGSLKTEFDADTDTFRLSERLLKLGMIWQWRANKGLPYAEDMANYEQLLAQLIVADKGARVLSVGTNRNRYDVHPSYPWSLG